MDTKAALIKFANGEMSGTEVVTQCPKLATLEDLSSEVARQVKQKKIPQSDVDTIRAFVASMSALDMPIATRL